jgi:hypothetical protein
MFIHCGKNKSQRWKLNEADMQDLAQTKGSLHPKNNAQFFFQKTSIFNKYF